MGEVHLLHVVTKGEPHEEIETIVEKAKITLDKMKTEPVSSGLPIKTHIYPGRPADEISSLAEREDISLIIMSSHGKGLLKELLVGSTTLGVAINVNRPLMVMRILARQEK